MKRAKKGYLIKRCSNKKALLLQAHENGVPLPFWVMTEPFVAVVACPTCEAAPWQACTTCEASKARPHDARWDAYDAHVASGGAPWQAAFTGEARTDALRGRSSPRRRPTS
jgi:hypothetical protein